MLYTTPTPPPPLRQPFSRLDPSIQPIVDLPAEFTVNLCCNDSGVNVDQLWP